MDIKKKILKDTFENAFDMANFEQFTREFFNKLQIVAPNKEIKNYKSEFTYTINSHYYVADYQDVDNKKIAVLAVELTGKTSVERARSVQRNFVSMLISNSGHDAAIVAFYVKNDNRWRLSFVRLDQEWIGMGKIKTTITPAKRFSYLVGENEPCHTAQAQLFPIFQNESFNPSLDKIEEAFSVESVTKEFFNEYKNKYHDLREHLETNEDFKLEAEKHQFTSEQFAKKLMGQLAFLYFLQKKGWLGVKTVPSIINEKRYKDAYYKSSATKSIIEKVYEQKGIDEFKLKASVLTSDSFTDDDADILASCFKPEPWGSGNKDFIRFLFEDCKKREGKNFFEDYLEPLFYEALRINRGKSQYYKRFNCKIPFLNGGLFDPLESYDWKHTSFNIPNSMFSNKDEKGERDCDGILDVFGRYNFTINEDEPLEREVAVDPEMLGKIFENLLDVKDRKSKGAFYTPREIVHYMCQESLTNYLVNETGVNYDDLKEFIVYGEIMKDEDCSNKINIYDDTVRKLPKDVFNSLQKIDNALENVKVADPAVGSGAFPLGMLSEIVRARNNITDYNAVRITNENSDSQRIQRAQYREPRNQYKIKRDTIKNSIYAVDIEASAVDIAKLRLWLSLIVDEDLEYYDYMTNTMRQKDPSPLPNLDYNVMCGNSLIDEFEGVKLFDDTIFDKKDEEKKASEPFQITMFQEQIELLTEKLYEDQDKLFNENNADNKKVLKAEIDKTIEDIIRRKLVKDGNTDGLAKYEENLKNKTKPYFLWKLEFGKVFREKGGFDVVIGNPPYIDSEGMVNSGMEEMRKLISEKYKFAKGNWDIYISFFELGFTFLSKNGNLSYITPDKWISKPFGDELRKGVIKNIDSILNAGRDIFESALVDSIVTNITKTSSESIKIYKLKNKSIIYDKLIEKTILVEPYNLDIIFSDSIDLICKIEKKKNQLSDMAICENACATSDAYKLKEIIFSLNNEDEFNENYYKIINTGTIGKYNSKWGIQKMTYLKDKYEFPVVDKQKFLTMFPNSYSKKTKQPKLIIKGLTLLDVCIDEMAEIIPGKTTLIITSDKIEILKFLLPLLNSKLFIFYIKEKYSSSSYNGGIGFTKAMINNLPIAEFNESIKIKILKISYEIMCLKLQGISADTKELENQIDQLVYKLYDLTEEEIKIIEEAIK